MTLCRYTVESAEKEAQYLVHGTYVPATATRRDAQLSWTDRVFAMFEESRMDEVGDISEQLQHDIELYDEALTRAWDGVPASMLAGLNDSFGALPSSGTKATNESIVEWRRTLWGEDNALPVGCSYTVNVGHGGITLASPFEKVFEYELQLGKNNKAAMHRNNGDLQEAAEQYREIAYTQDRFLGIHPVTAATHRNLGQALFDIGEHDEALGEWRRAVAMEEATLGTYHPVTRRTTRMMSDALEHLGDVAGALEAFNGGNPIPPTAAGLGYQPTDLRLLPHYRLAAARAVPGLFRRASKIATALGIRVKYGKIKKSPRVVFKLFSTKLGDFRAINDIGRLTFEAETLQQVADARAALAADPDITIVRDKMRLDPKSDRSAVGGYADSQTIVLVQGAGDHSMEVQVTLVALLRIKTADVDGAGGHKVFRKARLLLLFDDGTRKYHGEWSSELEAKIMSGQMTEVVLTGIPSDEENIVAALALSGCRLKTIWFAEDLGMAGVRKMIEEYGLLSDALADKHDNPYSPAGELVDPDALKDRIHARNALQALKLDPGVTEIDLKVQKSYKSYNDDGDEDTDSLRLALASTTAVLAAILTPNTTVTKVDLQNNMCQDDEVKLLAEMLKVNMTITNLDLGDNLVEDDGVAALAGVLRVTKTLRDLNLMGNLVGSAGFKALARALATNSSLFSLILDRNGPIDATSAAAVGDALRAHATLNYFSARSCSISAKGALGFARGLKVNTVLTLLSLDDNDLGDGGAVALARGLKANGVLHSLSLTENDIANVGAIALAKALEKNTALEDLNLSDNSIDTKGMRAMAKMLGLNRKLSSIKLSANLIADDGASALATALANNTSLHRLHLDANMIEDDGALALANMLEKNSTLRFVGLMSCMIGQAGKAGLALSGEVNPYRGAADPRYDLGSLTIIDGRSMGGNPQAQDYLPSAEAQQQASAHGHGPGSMLYWAACHGDGRIVEMLLRNNADVDEGIEFPMAPYGPLGTFSPLEIAVASGHGGVVKHLLAHGADTNLPTVPGGPKVDGGAIQVAKAQGHSAIVEMLKDHSSK